MLSVVLGLACAFAGANGANLPSGMVTCKQSDFECLAKSVTASIPILAAGNPKLGLPSLDPLFVKSIHIKGNGGRVDLEQTYIDMNLNGLAKIDMKVVKPDFNGANCNLHMEGFVSYLDFIGSYKVTGKLLLFTLNGHGSSNITLLNTAIKFDYKCVKIIKEGKEYVKITDLQLDMDPKKLLFDIANLIDGNEQLSAEVLKVMNENDLDIYKELKRDYENTFAEIFKQITANVFGRVPLKDLFVPE